MAFEEREQARGAAGRGRASSTICGRVKLLAADLVRIARSDHDGMTAISQLA